MKDFFSEQVLKEIFTSSLQQNVDLALRLVLNYVSIAQLLTILCLKIRNSVLRNSFLMNQLMLLDIIFILNYYRMTLIAYLSNDFTCGILPRGGIAG